MLCHAMPWDGRDWEILPYNINHNNNIRTKNRKNSNENKHNNKTN